MFACVACISMLDQPCIFDITFKKKHATKFSQIVITGQFWAHIKIVISLI